MEGVKSLIMCALVLGLVLQQEKIHVEAKSCCPSPQQETSITHAVSRVAQGKPVLNSLRENTLMGAASHLTITSLFTLTRCRDYGTIYVDGWAIRLIIGASGITFACVSRKRPVVLVW
uniref:Uncharacterized protein n=1 Tax=Oryza rufipogon TaxID=4529 RepID=A0A0E0PXF0_ORYRU